MIANTERTDNLYAFLRKTEKLKSALRYGSTTGGRKESAAEHSWRVALMTFIIADELGLDIDVCRAMKMAVVHDIAEAITGDIDFVTISDGNVTKDAKRHAERAAIAELRDLLSGSVGEELHALWTEYENGTTDVARYVKAIDRLETLTQLVESGHLTYDRPELIPNYADMAVAAFPALSGMLKSVKMRLREEFREGAITWKDEYGL
jgi:putative hydrolase of HD superfamily